MSGESVVDWFGYRDCLRLENGVGIRVVLCPHAGGRVLEYSQAGVNVMYLDPAQRGWRHGPGVPPVDPCGGRFDVGPERVIAPHPDLWLGDWTGEIRGDGQARLVSPRDRATGLRLVREFTLDASSSRLVCRQDITNESDRTVMVCHWGRTLAVGGGIVLVPLTPHSRFPAGYVMYGPGPVIDFRPEDPLIRSRDGFLEVLGTPQRPKLGMDSSAGWFAYLMRSGLLFAKRYPVFPDRVYGEVAGLTISIWYFRDVMCELEPIGPREMLGPGSTASFAEEWELLRHPFPESGAAVDLEAVARLAAPEAGGRGRDGNWERR
ncbi:MAG: DUF4380 domain-containing protein [Verrucomicrobia bacterium]|nr:DUF4380 domain-containing protein [Verrucomicrobiota bacterium]